MSTKERAVNNSEPNSEVDPGAPSGEVSEYPDGILENHGGKLPLFLKLTYVGFALFGVIYFILYCSGDGSPLVEEFNKLLHGPS